MTHARTSPGRLKMIVHARDQYRCRYCGIMTSYRAVNKPHYRTVDHLIPRSKGGRTTVVNLVTCCNACNGKKRSFTLRQAGMVLRPVPWHAPEDVQAWNRRFYSDRCVRCDHPAKRHSLPLTHGGYRKCPVGGTLFLSRGHYEYLVSVGEYDPEMTSKQRAQREA